MRILARLEVNGVPIQDDYSETFSGRLARVMVTSVTRRWALEAAMETKGLGRSATSPPCEATLEREVGPDETPDGRPGFVIQMMDRKLEQLARCLVLRLRKGALPNPKTSVFDALPAEMAEESIDVEGTIIQRFGDGWEEAAETFGRQVFRVPKMDGIFHVERRFGVVREAVTGGMFLILADSDETALGAAEAALEAVSRIPLVVVKNAASGSKVGAKNYHDMVATTNHHYCPALGRIQARVGDHFSGAQGGRPTLVWLTEMTPARAEPVERFARRYGVELPWTTGRDDAEKRAALESAEIAVCCARAGVQVLSADLMAQCAKLEIAADVNAVPPAGVEGLPVTGAGVELPSGALGIGALAIGGIKYQVQRGLLKRMMRADHAVVLDFPDAFDLAGETVSD